MFSVLSNLIAASISRDTSSIDASRTDSPPAPGSSFSSKRAGESAIGALLKRARNAGGENASTTLQSHTRFFNDGSVLVTGSQVPARVPVAQRITHIAAALNGRSIDAVAHSNDKQALHGATNTALGSWASDSHFHPTQYTQHGMVPDKMLAMMDQVGIYRSVIMPIPTDVIPCGTPDHNRIPGESYYVPKKFADLQRRELTAKVENEIVSSAHLSVNQQVDADTAMILARTKLTDAQRDRLDPMVTGLHLGSPLSSQALLFKLATHPNTYTGVGEVTIHKELVEHQFDGVRQANLTDNVQSFKHLVATAGVAGMPVVLHCDVDSTSNQRAHGLGAPEHLADIRNLLASSEVRGTTLIWAHFGGIGRFVAKPDNHMENLRGILGDPAMKHVHVDISWSRVARQIVMKSDAHGVERPDAAAIGAAVQLINEFPDRFLMGSDALDPQNKETWAETGKLYKPLLDQLTPQARYAVTIGNYERVIVGARPKVRAFEQHVLTDDFVKTRLRASGGTRLNDGPHIDPAALRAARDEAYAAAGVDLHGNPAKAAG